MVKIVTIPEDFYTDLYSSQHNNAVGIRPEEFDIPPVKREEVKKALEPMQSGKAADEEYVAADLLKDGG